MGLFGLGGDSTDGSDSSAGFLMPMAAQAMQADPRSALIQSMMQTGQQQLQQPTYSPMAALAKALTMGIGGASSGYLQKQYADASKSYPQALTDALSSGGNDANGQVLATLKSPNPLVRMYGTQLMGEYLKPVAMSPGQQMKIPLTGQTLAQNTAPLTDVGKLIAARDALPQGDPNRAPYDAQIQKLNSEGGVQLTGNGAAPIPGYGPAKGAIAGATDLGENPALISRAGGVSSAEVPGKVAAAVGTAQGTAPIETFTNMFKPQVNRVTGEISIPGLVDPGIVQRTMAAFGVTPQSFGGTHIAGTPAPGAGTNGGPAPAASPAPPPPTPAPVPIQPPVAPRAQSGQTPPAPSAAVMGMPQPQPQGSPTAPQAAVPQPQKPSGPVPIGTMNPMDEVPKVPLPTGEMPTSAGTISPGRDPIAIRAGEEGIVPAAKQYEETAAAAKASVSVQAQLGSMKSLLDQGKLITNAAGPAREEIAGWLSAAGLSDDATRQLTGIDSSAAAVYNKEGFRLGASLSRTLGAREAAQIVQQAIKANPNMATTVQGNKMVIDLLSQAAQHDIDAQTYSDAFFNKNGHYVGAQGWFNQNHPVAEYTSKVIPYQAPRLASGQVNISKLAPNVTYQGANGLGIWNGQAMIPVQQ